MTAQQISKFKAKLLAEKRRVQAEMHDYLSLDDPKRVEDRNPEIADYDENDPADEASDLYDRDRAMAAKENLTNILAKIDRALKKIEDGTYGLSDVDGAPIPLARLEVLPYALATVEQEETL